MGFISRKLLTIKSPSSGIKWNQAAFPSGVTQVTAIAYGNGMFVGIVRNTNIAVYSSNGITWNSSTLPANSFWKSVTYGNGRFVAIADYSNNSVYGAAYSLNGVNWATSSLTGDPSQARWSDITYGNGKFIAVSSKYNIGAYSGDGVSWGYINLPTPFRPSESWNGVAFGNDRFVAVGGTETNNNNVKASMYSLDGISWNFNETLPALRSWNSVTYGNGLFIAVSSGPFFDTSNFAAYSADGINWGPSILADQAYWNAIAYGDNKFVAVSSVSNFSYNGQSWGRIQFTNSNFSMTDIAFGNNRFIAVGSAIAYTDLL